MITGLDLKKHSKYFELIEYFKTQVYKYFPTAPKYDEFQLFFKTGNRIVYEDKYFERRKQLTYLGLLLLDDPANQKYKVKLENLIYSICNEFTWCLPAHVDIEKEFNCKEKKFTIDLFSSETAFTLSEQYRLLGDVLSKDILNLMHASILQRVIVPFLSEKWIFEDEVNNWSSVCAGSIGISALYIMSDSVDRKIVLNRVNHAMKAFLSGYGEDGACLEGLNYWQYGFRYFTYYSDMYESQTRKSFLSDTDLNKIKSIAAFQQKMYAYERTVYNISDSPSTMIPASDLAHYYHLLFPGEISIPVCDWSVNELLDHCGRWAPVIRTLMWEKQSIYSKHNKEEYYWLEDSGIYIFNNKELQFLSKGGSNDEPHNHNDLGHFILHFKKQPICIDLGAPQYTKDYFNDKRYDYIQASSKGHSVPIINGKYQVDGEGNFSRAIVYDQVNQLVTYDLTRAYENNEIDSFNRTFKLSPEVNRLDVVDNYLFTVHHNQIEQRIFFSKMEIESRTDFQLIFRNRVIRTIVTFLTYIESYTTNSFKYIDHFGSEKEATMVSIYAKNIPCKYKMEFSIQCFEI